MGYYDNYRDRDYRSSRDSYERYSELDSELRSRGYSCSYGHYTDPDNPTRTGAHISNGKIVMDM